MPPAPRFSAPDDDRTPVEPDPAESDPDALVSPALRTARPGDGVGDGQWLDELNADELRRLIRTMPVIEQAKGMVMAYYGMPADRAFALLRRWSSTHNVKLRSLCAEIVAAAGQPHDGDPFAGLRETLSSRDGAAADGHGVAQDG